MLLPGFYCDERTSCQSSSSNDRDHDIWAQLYHSWFNLTDPGICLNYWIPWLELKGKAPVCSCVGSLWGKALKVLECFSYCRCITPTDICILWCIRHVPAGQKSNSSSTAKVLCITNKIALFYIRNSISQKEKKSNPYKPLTYYQGFGTLK